VQNRIESLIKNRMDFEKIKDSELSLHGMAARKNVVVKSKLISTSEPIKPSFQNNRVPKISIPNSDNTN
jgi:hypothetical protein